MNCKNCKCCKACCCPKVAVRSGYQPRPKPPVINPDTLIPPPPAPPENIKVSDLDLIPLGLIMYIGSIIVAGLIGYFVGVSV